MKKAILILSLVSAVSASAQTIINPRFVGKRCVRAQVNSQNLPLVIALLQRADLDYKVTGGSGNYLVTAQGPNMARGQINSLTQNPILLENGVDFRATTRFPEKCTDFNDLVDLGAI